MEDSTKVIEKPEDGEATVGAEVKEVKVPTKEELDAAMAKAEKKWEIDKFVSVSIVLESQETCKEEMTSLSV